MTWWSECSAVPRFVLAKSAIRCRFVDRFAGSRVPSLVSLQRFSPRDVSLPSLGSRRARFPDVSGTMKTLRLPAACTRFLMVSVAGSTTPRVVRVRRGAPDACRGHSSGLGHWSAGVPLPAVSVRGRERDLSGCLAIHPMPLPCSSTPAEPANPHLLVDLPMPPPAPTDRRPQRVSNLEACHTASASAAYASRAALPLPMQGWLPAGGLRLYREGVEPSGSL
jgi:hypothetical protein